ncbi:uncharacterized protein LOC105274565 isoform X2 [Ooceraea biroi]|uniref:uncharacterized protein LOC105274565 isoform X2 n=1 Tax=Ooceraea biroi TaxID=2015173 RepID=UPI0005BD768D|nr:uncharacterized protein LOC105274565 isoform X2 [Ooceraea biroi]
MEETFYQKTIAQVNKAQIILQTRLEQVSKLKIDCAKLQLELLKLYKPECLKILEELRDISASADSADESGNGDGDGDDGQSRNNREVDNEDRSKGSKE